MLAETSQAKNKKPLYRRVSIWLWVSGWLVALLATGLLIFVRPELTVPILGKGSQGNLSGINAFVEIQRKGISDPVTDPLDSTTYQTVNGGVEGRFQITATSFRPMELYLEARGGPARISVNNKSLAEITATSTFQRFVYTFTPAHQDNQGPPLLILTISGPLQLKSATLDFTSQWEPFLSESDFLSTGFVIGLVTLFVLSFLQWRFVPFPLTALPVAFLIYLSWRATENMLAVGFSGELNNIHFWLLLLCPLFLAIFGFWWSLAAVPLGHVTLYDQLKPYWLSFRFARPSLSAFITITLANALLMVLFYGPVVILSGGWDNLARFWDGPEYLVNARSLYDPNDPILNLPFFARKSEIYWGAHFPGYSLLIRVFAPFFGYVASMFVINFIATVIFGVVLFRFLRDFGYSRQPLWLSVLFLFLPLRWLIYHSVGASEGLTLMFIMLSVYAFKRNRYWQAGIWGICVVWTRPNGIFLLAGFGLFLLWEALQKAGLPENISSWVRQAFKTFRWQAFPVLVLMPVALAGVFALYGFRYGDFWVYLKIPEQVTHIYPFPFLSMEIRVTRSEGDFYYYILQTAGLVLLWRRKLYDIFWIGLVLFLPTVFLLHDDVLRYALPAFPFVITIPFAFALESKYTRWFAIPALIAVLIYSWSQLFTNMVDADTWQQMLELLK